MQQVEGFIRDYNALIILGLAALDLILLMVAVSLSARFSKFARRRKVKLDSGQLGEIVDYITDQSHTLDAIKNTLSGVSTKQDDLDTALAWCVQHVGVVRFNAFDDVGGEQSFTLALLDANKTGVIISSLHGRQDCRAYIKSIDKGETERLLSEEEQRAVKAALRQ